MSIQDKLRVKSEYEVHEMIEKYLETLHETLCQMKTEEAKREVISGYNRLVRKDKISHQQLEVNVGDVCYIDYGQAYLNEAGFQHFGLVVALFNFKAFVIPMSSNPRQIKRAVNYPGVKYYKDHLYYIGKIEGLNKHSVLFLNDGKFINTSRIISINGKIDPQTRMFKEIKQVMNRVFS